VKLDAAAAEAETNVAPSFSVAELKICEDKLWVILLA